MSEYAVLSNGMMAAGGEMGRVRGIWTVHSCWQWWMLAPKYSTSDFLYFIYLYIPWNWGHFGPIWLGGARMGKKKRGEAARRTLGSCERSFYKCASVGMPLTALVKCKHWPSAPPGKLFQSYYRKILSAETLLNCADSQWTMAKGSVLKIFTTRGFLFIFKDINRH